MDRLNIIPQREAILSSIVERVSKNKAKGIPQHIMLSGDEGVGKSYMLTCLAERLADVAEIVSFRYPYALYVKAETIIARIQAATVQRQKVILIDDFDKMLDLLPVNEQYKLRAFFFTENAPTLVGTITGAYPGFHDYRAPFYDAFLVMHIEPMEVEEWLSLADEKVRDRVENDSAFTDAVSTLGSNMHYIHRFAELYADANMSAAECMQKLIQENSRYFNLLISTLPVSQQQVLMAFAMQGGSATSSQIKDASSLDPATLPSSISRLLAKKLLSKADEKKRNGTYTISDRLLADFLQSC
jgi:DNA-directed RNA polymerase subunit F